MWQTVCTPKRGCPGCDSAPWSDLSCLSAARQSLKGQKENMLESWECFENHNHVFGSSNFICSFAKWVRYMFTGNNYQILSGCCGSCENLSDFRGRKILDLTQNFIILFPGWILNKPNAHPLIFFLPLSSTLFASLCSPARHTGKYLPNNHHSSQIQFEALIQNICAGWGLHAAETVSAYMQTLTWICMLIPKPLHWIACSRRG